MKTLTTLLTCATILISTQGAYASANTEVYRLKGETQTGSKIPTIAATSNVPFNKAYDALSVDQQQLVNAKFDTLGANQRPPYPSQGLASVYKPMLKANKLYGDNQSLSVQLSVNGDGQVNNVAIEQDISPEFMAYLDRNLRKASFDPANCNGTPCSMNFPLEISFN